jgi:hypothetical protein
VAFFGRKQVWELVGERLGMESRYRSPLQVRLPKCHVRKPHESAKLRTQPPGVTSAAQRKRRQRARDRTLLYSRDDWGLFLDAETLPQKAGCHPDHLRKVVLKELDR